MADSANFSANGTKLANLINPQVMADMIDKKLIDLIKFSPLAIIDTTLQGRPGNTVTLPSYAYIGDAEVVDEAADIPIKQLTASSKEVTIYKIGNGVEITDESVLSGYGDPLGEAVDQLALSIASKEDKIMLDTMKDSYLEYHYSGSSATADDIADALVKFGEDIEGDKVILVSPEQYAAIRKADDWVPASDIAAELLIKGVVGMIHGCQVSVSNKLTATNPESYIVKPGALAIFLKRDTLVETDRDIIAKFTVATADKHFATYIYDDSKIIRICKATQASGITVTTAKGADATHTDISSAATAATGNALYYKVGTGLTVPNVGDVLDSTWLAFTSPVDEAECASGDKAVVVEADGNKKVVKGGSATVTVGP